MLTQTFDIRHVIALEFSLFAEIGKRKQTTQPAADKNKLSYISRVGTQARSAQSRDSPLERDWRPELVGFASVEVMSVESLTETLESRVP